MRLHWFVQLSICEIRGSLIFTVLPSGSKTVKEDRLCTLVFCISTLWILLIIYLWYSFSFFHLWIKIKIQLYHFHTFIPISNRWKLYCICEYCTFWMFIFFWCFRVLTLLSVGWSSIKKPVDKLSDRHLNFANGLYSTNNLTCLCIVLKFNSFRFVDWIVFPLIRLYKNQNGKYFEQNV